MVALLCEAELKHRRALFAEWVADRNARAIHNRFEKRCGYPRKRIGRLSVGEWHVRRKQLWTQVEISGMKGADAARANLAFAADMREYRRPKHERIALTWERLIDGRTAN